MKLREGRGFTKDELKAAGIRRKEALTIGVPVDHRRRNRSEEGLKVNVERLEAYKKRLVVFPRKAGKVKSGDTAVSCLSSLVWRRRESFEKRATTTGRRIVIIFFFTTNDQQN